MNVMSQRVYYDGVYMRGEIFQDFQQSYLRLIENQIWTKKNDETLFKKECKDDTYTQPFNPYDMMKKPTDHLLTIIFNKMEG